MASAYHLLEIEISLSENSLLVNERS